MAIVTPTRPSLDAIANAVVADAQADAIAALTAQVAALTALIAQQATPTPTRKATTPKPRPKAAHGKGVTKAMQTEYATLWRARLDLRKQLGLTSWADDEACKKPAMKALVSRMAELRDAGVNQFLLAPAKK